MLIALYVTMAFLVGILVGLGLLHGFVMPKMEERHIAEMVRMTAAIQEYGTCEECGARGPRYEHSVTKKRVCRNREACLARVRV